MKPIKETGGIVSCLADAVKEVREISDYVCSNKGGEWAVRKFIEWLNEKSGKEYKMFGLVEKTMLQYSCHKMARRLLCF